MKHQWMIGLLSSVVLAHPSYANTNLQCEQAIEEQLDAYFTVVDAFAEECERVNDELDDDGLPNCGSICTESMVQNFKAPEGSVKVTVGNKSSSGGFGSGGFSFGGTSSSGSSSSSDKDKPKFSVELELKFTLGPSTELKCVNPMFAPIVKEFAMTILNSTWVQEKYQEACAEAGT